MHSLGMANAHREYNDNGQIPWRGNISNVLLERTSSVARAIPYWHIIGIGDKHLEKQSIDRLISLQATKKPHLTSSWTNFQWKYL